MDITYENGEIVVRIKCGPEEIAAAKTTASGKSRMIANTGGFTKIEGAPEGVRIGINVITKAD